MSHAGNLCWILFCLLVFCAPGIRGETNQASKVVYSVGFRGVSDDAVKTRLEGLSQTVALKNRPPPTFALLERRIEGDIERFRALLASDGYFDGTVTPSINRTSTPVRVVFELARGPRYGVGEVQIHLPDTSPGLPSLNTELQAGAPVTTQDILDEEGRLVRRLRDHGYPFAASGQRQVVVNHETRTVDLTFGLAPGERAAFGDLHLEGQKTVREKAIRKRVPWSEGDPYSAKLIDTYRRELLGTGMFLAVNIERGDALDEEGMLPLTVRVTERKRRSVVLGLEYESDIGFGANLDWEHRNFLTREFRLDMTARYTEIELAYEVHLTRQRFLRPDQSILLSARVAEDSPDAYTSVNEELTLQVARRVSSQLRVSGGVATRISEVEQVETTENYALLLSPWTLDFNFSDNLLDPTRGGRAILELAPYTDMRSGNLTFTRTFGEYRHFLSTEQLPGVVLAGRLALGALSGADRADIPADEQFYAGGGGSIRGYEYQTVGDIVDGQPIGGNSLIETSLELRTHFSEMWGLVAFLDGGMAYESSTPTHDLSLQWGAGLGVRIFTDMGPIRVDVAVPVNPRDDLDEDYQFYISLGQAF